MFDEYSVADLEVMSQAVIYHKWLFEQIAPYLGKRIVEVGAGIGTYAALMEEAEEVLCVEPNPPAFRMLEERFRCKQHVQVVQESATSEPFLEPLHAHFDTAVSLNVLEHIEDDALACRNVHKLLVTGGHFCVIVPALPLIYGTIDKKLLHFRRYRKRALRRLLEDAGFEIIQLYYMNLPGAFGWFLTNRVLRQDAQSAAQAGFYSKVIVPVTRRVEKVVRPPFGMSLVAISRAR